MSSVNKDKVKFTLNIAGNDVDVVERFLNGKQYYCLYVILPDSQYLHTDFFGESVWSGRTATGVDDDLIGVDTAHTWLEKRPMEEKLIDGIKQITNVINRYEWAINGNQDALWDATQKNGAGEGEWDNKNMQRKEVADAG